MKTASNFSSDPEWPHDMIYAFEVAVSLMEQEEFGGDNPERQRAAYLDVARRIDAMRKRYESKLRKNTR